MCFMINHTVAADGAARGGAGWLPITAVNVGFDHATGSRFEHAVLLDFVDPQRGPAGRVAVELDLDSARGLVAALQGVIEAAERAGAAA